MASYPAIPHQLPLSHSRRFANAIVDMAAGIRHAYYHEATALRGWDVTLDLSDADAATIQQFFEARGGAWEPFTFTDPDAGGTVTVRFAGESLNMQRTDPNRNLITFSLVEVRT